MLDQLNVYHYHQWHFNDGTTGHLQIITKIKFFQPTSLKYLSFTANLEMQNCIKTWVPQFCSNVYCGSRYVSKTAHAHFALFTLNIKNSLQCSLSIIIY